MGYWEREGKSNEWYTPKYIFSAMECHFNQDVAAPVDRRYNQVPANEFITVESLSRKWNGFIWMNPPFEGRNGIVPWLEKFIRHGNGVALTPDRTSTAWWHLIANNSNSVLFVKNKVKFLKPDGSLGENPSNGTTLFAIGKKAVAALHIAEDNELGLCIDLLPVGF